MIEICKQNSNWTLITIADPNCLSGKSVFNIIHVLTQLMEFKFVILDDIIGAKTSSLVEKENIVIEIDYLLKIICDVVQFDWGDFFLFKKYPKNWVNSKELKYPDIISQTDTTIRAIDSGYIYIYTPYDEIVNLIKSKHTIESIKKGPLNTLDYPY